MENMLEYLPEASRSVPASDDKFLFFFNPINLEDRFLFGITPKTYVQIFAVISLIQAISSFLDIFSPNSFWLFLIAIIAFVVYCIVALYAFLATMKENYSYAKVSYLIVSVLFLISALKYLCKSVIKTIEFITPWDGDFLRLDFLVYIFGYGIYLFLYLYLIYILYRYMIQLKNPNPTGNLIPRNNEEELALNNEDKNL